MWEWIKFPIAPESMKAESGWGDELEFSWRLTRTMKGLLMDDVERGETITSNSSMSVFTCLLVNIGAAGSESFSCCQ
jgi:hypothetical protein